MDDVLHRTARGELRYHESMADHCSWRAGGKADCFFWPQDQDDLLTFLKVLPETESVYWVGLGSNLLVRDGGLRGVVICTCNRLRQMTLQGEGRVLVQAGVPCALVARFCAENGLTGAEFLAGIPGTFGGALAMNAGAFGGEVWDYVRSVTTVDRCGVVRDRGTGDYVVGYRSVVGPKNEWFLGGMLQLQVGDGESSRERIKGLLARRNETQPTSQPSCGSVFRNPEGDFAARLIEACGLKGRRIGAAEVSRKHANFIVNTGGAKAADIEALIGYVRSEVLNRQGIELMPEVRIVGEHLQESQ